MKTITTTALKACLTGVILTLYLALSVSAIAASNTQAEQPTAARQGAVQPAADVRRAAIQSTNPGEIQHLRSLWLLTAEQLATESELYILPAEQFALALQPPPSSNDTAEVAATPLIDWFFGLRAAQIEQAGLNQGPQIGSRNVTLFQRRHLPQFGGIEDASGYVVGVVEHSHAAQWLQQHHPDLSLRTFTDLDSLLDAAAAGRIHVFAGPVGTGSALPTGLTHVDAGTTPSAVTEAAAGVSQAFPSDRRLLLFSEPLYLATREAADAVELSEAFQALNALQQGKLQAHAYQNMASVVSLQEDELEWLLTQDRIVVGVPIESRPIIYFDSQGEAKGLDVDFLNLLSERSSLNFAYSGCGNWEACLRALAAREIDILSFTSNTPARREYAAFTSVYWETPWAIAASEPGVFGADRLENIQDKRIAITRSYSIFEQAAQLPNLDAYPVHSPEEGMLAVLEGHADGYLDSLPLLVERVRGQHTGNLYLTILHGQPGDAVSFAVRNDWPVLRDIMDRTVQTLTEADQQRIAERWFDVNYEQGLSLADIRRWVVYAAVLVGLLITFFVWRNSRLRNEVQRRRRAEKQMRHLARHDDLTGLPNRHLLDDRMTQILASHQRHGRQFAVLFLDLDGFKEVNDAQGHEVGDALLKQVAMRLNDSVRAQDTVCRFGGDEFIVILTELDNPTQAMRVAQKLVDRVIEPYHLTESVASTPGDDEQQISHVSVSIGVAMFPQHSEQGAELLRMADKAMYEVKREGKNGVRMAPGLQ